MPPIEKSVPRQDGDTKFATAIITSVNEAPDDELYVTGVLAAEEMDFDHEIMHYEKSKPYFAAWSRNQQDISAGKSMGNVRGSHSTNQMIGKLTSLDFDDAGKKVKATAKVVDRDAKEKVREGVYTSFSIGASRVKSSDVTPPYWVANPFEVSLVDLGCMPSTRGFTYCALDGHKEERKFANQSSELLANREEISREEKTMETAEKLQAELEDTKKKLAAATAEFAAYKAKQEEDDGEEDDSEKCSMSAKDCKDGDCPVHGKGTSKSKAVGNGEVALKRADVERIVAEKAMGIANEAVTKALGPLAEQIKVMGETVVKMAKQGAPTEVRMGLHAISKGVDISAEDKGKAVEAEKAAVDKAKKGDGTDLVMQLWNNPQQGALEATKRA